MRFSWLGRTAVGFGLPAALAMITLSACSASGDAMASGSADLTSDDVTSVLQSAAANAMALQVNDASGAHWNMPAYMGHHYISQYYLLTRWLGVQSPIDTDVFWQLLLDEQKADGSWEAVHDATLDEGDLTATILNYAALKAMGVSATNPDMARARTYILSHGGMDKCNTINKFVFALFGVFDWQEVTPLGWNVPGSLAKEGLFAQWTGPHLRPMAYLRARKVQKDLGARFHLDELFTTSRAPFASSDPPELTGTPYTYVEDFLGRGAMPDDGQLNNEATSTDPRGLHSTRQQPGGSWGGYTTSTLLTVISLADYQSFVKASPTSEYATYSSSVVSQAMQRGLDFVASITTQDAKAKVPYQGPVMDGHVWDSALISIGLEEAGQPMATVTPALDHLVAQQVKGVGGFPFGKDFYYAPDSDDTAEVVMALLHGGQTYKSNIGPAVQWLKAMQDSDGGWAAFSKDNTGNPITRLMMSFAADSVSPFDLSCPDVTGHVLEALGDTGERAGSSRAIDDAVSYLRNAQGDDGSWEGRWGVNHVYGTGAAVTGLASVGVGNGDPMMAKALGYLHAQQNADGGYGESMHSYEVPTLKSGKSTPTQTAWALIAMLATGDATSSYVKDAVQFLVTDFKKNGAWVDPSSVGTGHPGIVYMQYPSYAVAFPMTALARYAKHLRT